ncbi:hypothetical protein BDZ94DRAFT_1204828 [Collybia nuda]|uniref:Transmembrane protein 135 N-terminal domain-containing protein n=1 Tax=Collybia nuda TaxID=64659 RepID=A0A9P5XSS9_9AGAR|nr:hypothetical protein BDZ94DRAFT_1204828 [Collybia nuda]
MDDATHPVQIALRTYALSLSLSLGPSLVPIATSLFISTAKTPFIPLKRVLKRELALDSFAFAITLSVAGGAAIRRLWSALDQEFHDTGHPSPPLQRFRSARRRLQAFLTCLNVSSSQKTFLSNVFSSAVGIMLLKAGRQRAMKLRNRHSLSAQASSKDCSSPTLDLTILLLVRAMDSLLQALIRAATKPSPKHDGKSRRKSTSIVTNKYINDKVKQTWDRQIKTRASQIDALIFWGCSARIMWCFFYDPGRLPRSYVKWIATLANLDDRVIQVLNLIKEGQWSYTKGSPLHSEVLSNFAEELGHNALWGDPSALPAYGGATANAAWKVLGVNNRPGVGGLPCELVHGTVGSTFGLQGSCTVNSSLRAVKAFFEAVAIYLPAHFLPMLLTRPGAILQPHHTLSTLFGALRSATFLTTFVTSYWYTVCLTRTLVFARIFPFISHDFWDGPFGCILAGCMVCGSSIWIENGRRRGEMALYVLPRAIRACLPGTWAQNGNRGAQIAERLLFILSFSTLITAAMHHPETLRGLSRWTLAFITSGPSAGAWKWRRQNPKVPLSSTILPTSSIPNNSDTLKGIP